MLAPDRGLLNFDLPNLQVGATQAKWKLLVPERSETCEALWDET